MPFPTVTQLDEIPLDYIFWEYLVSCHTLNGKLEMVPGIHLAQYKYSF